MKGVDPRGAAGHSVLQATDLRYQYGQKTVLEAVTFSLQPGEQVALVGPNGAGKSTLLRLLCGLRPGFAGSVELLGRPLRELSSIELARCVALIPQEGPFERDLLAGELVLTGLAPVAGAWSDGGSAGQSRAHAMMAETGTLDLANRPLHTLSGGELKRVLVARALLRQPELLLMDEPLAALDLGAQGRVLDLMALAAGRGTAVLVALHDLNLVRREFGRALLLEKGRLVADGNPREQLSSSAVHRIFGAALDGAGYLFPSRGGS